MAFAKDRRRRRPSTPGRRRRGGANQRRPPAPLRPDRALSTRPAPCQPPGKTREEELPRPAPPHWARAPWMDGQESWKKPKENSGGGRGGAGGRRPEEPIRFGSRGHPPSPPRAPADLSGGRTAGPALVLQGTFTSPLRAPRDPAALYEPPGRPGGGSRRQPRPRAPAGPPPADAPSPGAWPPAQPARARAALTSRPHPRTLHPESGPGPCAPEDMEFVSGYRDEFLDFAALLFGWFRKFVAERGAVRTSLEGRWWQLEAQIRRLPQDPALWVLHVLPNRSVGISLGQGAEPGPGPGLGSARLLGDDPPLHLRDLSPYVSFVSLEDGEEGEEEEEEDEEEKREDRGAGTEKVEPEEDRELAPTSRESPQETNPAGESEEADREAGGGKDGCREDRVENQTRPQKTKGQRSEAAPLHLSCLLLVTDEHGTILGIDLLVDGAQGTASWGSGTENLAPRAYALLCHSMACPMGSGDPRKPQQLTVGDARLHRELESLVPRLGVKLAKTPMRTWGPRPGFTFASLRARTCHVCHRHSFEVKLTPCPQCSAVLYCGEACLRADWRRCPDDVSHRFWCPRLASFMDRAGELAALPFTYTAEVTSETFNKEAFLATRGLTRGYWTQLSMLIPAPGSSRHPRGSMPSLSLLRGGDPYQLLQGDGPALMPPVPPDPPRALFGSWQDYYTWRGLSLDSPTAVLLTYPLTVYYVITHLVPQSFPELNIQNKQSLKIHVVEAGKEFDLVMVFWELLVLLPHVALELQFVGDGLPPESDQQHFTLQRDGPKVSVRPGSGISARPSSGTKEKGARRDLQIKVSARPYHLLQGPKPDLVIGFNSGFGLKDTWLSSLPRLQSLRVPAFFTESSEYGCVMDDQTMAVATGGGTSPPQPNPFRSPFRLRAADNCMPWYCNAFIFHLVYKPAQGSGARPAPGPPPPSPTPSAPPALTRRRRGEKKPGRGARRRR
ncbi:zinc finger MYND domain-containing protein 15 isoform X2 [Rhinopithecus roxellana]|uniref:zinc finger MYND domain-containing protein 15 isoform X2 n=1 Tax=Rhinopithecus roxellana TaxID=61622 RepID=UPI0012377947|nr:zinc finger MYND domain-containing protein 15 isoform X2 [Rhinopithecus roxellana]